jgi:ABC-type transporter Mla subunit MlaD
MERRAAIGDTIAQLRGQLGTVKDPNVQPVLTRLVGELEQHAQALQAQTDLLASSVAQREATIASVQVQLAAVNASLADRDAKVAALQKQLDQVKATASSATPQSLATSFKNVMDTVQAQARESAGTGTTIKSMQIEIKGLVQVQDSNPVLVFPAPGAPIDGAHLSTLRVEFAAVPTAPGAAKRAPPTS